MTTKAEAIKKVFILFYEDDATKNKKFVVSCVEDNIQKALQELNLKRIKSDIDWRVRVELSEDPPHWYFPRKRFLRKTYWPVMKKREYFLEEVPRVIK